MKVNELSPGWALRQPDPIAALQQVFNNMRAYSVRQLKKAGTKAAAAAPSVVLALQGILCVAFCFALMFFAALIGG